MRLHKNLFAGTCAAALLMHAVGLYLWHRIPLASGWLSPRHFTPYISTLQEKKMRGEVLSEIFQKLSEAPQEMRHEFHDLSPEQLPPPTLILNSEDYSQDLSFSLPSLPQSLSFPTEMDNEFFIPEIFTVSEQMTGSHPAALAPPPLADFGLQSDDCEALGALTNSEHFLISLEVAARSFRPGYVFRILLQPKQTVTFKRIRQNYYFLVDRSNSIPRARYLLNKRAVSAALAHLHPEDTFNILIFDDRVSRLSEMPIPCTPENIVRARGFLENQGHGGHFAATELYASLGKIIPKNVTHQEINTAILLSDGDTYLTLDKQRQTIGGWTGWNAGKVSLYCVASGTGNNIALLDIISSFNKGALIYIPEHEQITEKVVNFIQSLQTPIGKDLVATAVTADKQTLIHLQPRNTRLPNLYQNRPFAIWGCTNRLTDFTLFLQGRYYDKVFDIKKTISFKGAKTGTLTLERQWAQLAAQEYYEHFFQDGKMGHLEAARQFLAPLNLPVPLLQKP